MGIVPENRFPAIEKSRSSGKDIHEVGIDPESRFDPTLNTCSQCSPLKSSGSPPVSWLVSKSMFVNFGLWVAIFGGIIPVKEFLEKSSSSNSFQPSIKFSGIVPDRLLCRSKIFSKLVKLANVSGI